MTGTIALNIAAANWWTANSRLHHMDKARRTKTVRHDATIAALTILTPTDCADVHVLVQIPTARRFDADNAAPMAKAAIDGIVDAGILPDDNAKHRPRTTYELGRPTGERGLYRLSITLLPPITCPSCASYGCIAPACPACLGYGTLPERTAS